MPPKKEMSAGKIIGIVAIVVFFLVVIINMASGSPSSTTSTSQTTSTQTTPASTSPQTSFGDGTFIVGTDIEPGTYRTTGGSDCYYERLSGFGGTVDDIIANENTNGNGAIVTIAPTDKGFHSSGCATWTQINSAPSSSKKSSTTSAPIPQSFPASVSPVPLPQAPLHAQLNWSAYQAVGIETYLNDPQAYLDNNILVGAVSDGIFLPGSGAGASNYVEVGDPTQRNAPKLEVSVPIQSDYSAAVAQLEGNSIYPVRIYGTGFPSQSFSLTNGGQSMIPVIVAQRIDRCSKGFGDMQLTVVYGQTTMSDIMNACPSWQTIFP